MRHEIVHNGHVVESVTIKSVCSFQSLAEVSRVAPTVFSAHGVSQAAGEETFALGLPALDATYERHARRGRSAAVIGHAGHPEVEGTTGRVPGPAFLIISEEDVAALELAADTLLPYVIRTTLSLDGTINKARGLGPSELTALSGAEEEMEFRLPSGRPDA